MNKMLIDKILIDKILIDKILIDNCECLHLKKYGEAKHKQKTEVFVCAPVHRTE